MTRAFLTALWTNLILVSWKIDPNVVKQFLPKGLEPDLFDDQAYVSLVAFEFQNTTIKGFSIPFHKSFPEINLRMYARHGKNRGVVFLREFVPKHCVVWVARYLYNEPYYYKPLTNIPVGDAVKYEIGASPNTSGIEVQLTGESYIPENDSLEHFLKENDRGFGLRHQTLINYGVSHDIWPVRNVSKFSCDFDYASLYGPSWAWLGETEPANITFAVGSSVQVFAPTQCHDKI